VREAAAKAREITASNLGERLHVASAPDELKDLVESFNQMLDRLQDAFQRLSQFSSDLAHEFRTPVSNLLVQSQVAIARPRSNEEYQALLASNIEEFERLSRMIESMLFLARADNAQLVLLKETIDIGADLGRIVEYFEGPADDAGIRLTVDAQGTLVADRSLLRRAVSNLIANAIRFTPRGGTVSVVGTSSADGYVIRVQNPGPGIPPEHRDRIFDRFYRVDPARGGSSASTGLGLALVRSIMELHRGQALVSTSTHAKSTEFQLVFPASPPG
jgi:two-component system heavy metal sensor histidine kinase CusS